MNEVRKYYTALYLTKPIVRLIKSKAALKGMLIREWVKEAIMEKLGKEED